MSSIYSHGSIFAEFERKKVKGGWEKLRADMDAQRELADQAARDRANVARLETNRRMILREYDEAGIEPIYTGGDLISLGLARLLGHRGLHAGHTDMVPDYAPDAE